MRKFLGTVFIVIIVLFFAGCVISITSLRHMFPLDPKPLKSSILVLDLDGIIIDPTEFLEDLREYAKEDSIKGVLVRINSPGGVVGPSQEIFSELQRVRNELKKPVVVSCSSMAASGAYYAAVAADLIFANPGTLMGSIGVIMTFTNLEGLYDWAKISRYSIKTGQFKDAGAEYKQMTEAERQLFQELADEILFQFKKAVGESRRLRADVVDQYSDGRVFTGETAVKLKFADRIGSFEDARRAVGELAGLGADPDIFEPPPERPRLADFLTEMASRMNPASKAFETLQMQLSGQPLYLLPSVLPGKH